MTKTLRDYLKDESFQNRVLAYDVEGKNPIWFVSNRYKAIISIQDETARLREKLNGSRDESILIGMKAYHPYAGGMMGCSNLPLHLEDKEATEEDHIAKKKSVEKYWQGLIFEKQRELVQFTYDMGGRVCEEDIKKYNIEIS